MFDIPSTLLVPRLHVVGPRPGFGKSRLLPKSTRGRIYSWVSARELRGLYCIASDHAVLRSFILIRVLYRESRLSYFENLTSSNISSLLDPRLLGPRRLENTKSTEHLPAPASVCLSTSRPSLRSFQPTRNRIPTHGSHQVQPIHRRGWAPPVLPHVVSHAFATGQHHRHSLHLEKSHFSLHLEKTFSFHFPPSPTCINPILDNTISIKSPRPRFFFSFQTRPGSTDAPIATRRDREIQSHDATAGTHAYPPQARAPVPWRRSREGQLTAIRPA